MYTKASLFPNLNLPIFAVQGWYDAFLQWDEEYWELDRIVVTSNKVWLPELYVENRYNSFALI